MAGRSGKGAELGADPIVKRLVAACSGVGEYQPHELLRWLVDDVDLRFGVPSPGESPPQRVHARLRETTEGLSVASPRGTWSCLIEGTQQTQGNQMQQPTLKLKVIHSSKNYRRRFSEGALLDLEEQVKAAGGFLEPIIVRPHPTLAGHYEIIAGERRWRVASKLYGGEYDMPIVIREATDAEARALGIIENHGRDDPSVIEEAEGAAELLSYNAGDKAKAARQLGWSIDTLERRVLLLQCVPSVRDALMNERIELGHAELLAGLDGTRQESVLTGVIEHKIPVGALKQQLGQFARKLADAIFDTAVCVACQHNSAQQAALFDAAIGDGYCQNPAHYDELTLAEIDKKAAPLREQYQVVRIYKAKDGFLPLPVGPDGELGVGAEQYAACKGCASFGCSVSAVAGSYGSVEESLCFDAQCHSTKVAERRKAEREAAASSPGASTTTGKGAGKPKTRTAAPSPAPRKVSNQTPPRIVQYRQERWRGWAASALMADEAKCHRVLAALLASSSLSACHAGKFVEATVKLVKPQKFGSNLFKGALEQADAIDAQKLGQVVQAVSASAAFSASISDLEVLLNYLEVDEAKHFRLSAEYLELHTMSELESLADELKLRKAMGDGSFKKARSSAKPAFIQALLNVTGFDYTGVVPKAMRYARKKLRVAQDQAADPSNESGDKVQQPQADEPVEATP